jgi:hypothetical protein
MSKAEDANCLGLAGDGDEEDLVRHIEECFGVSFGQRELEHVRTVGELHDQLLRNLSGTAPVRRTHCRSAAAFRRLRHAFKNVTGTDVRPSTTVAALMKRQGQGNVIREIEAQSGLSLDAVSLSRCAGLASLAAAALLPIVGIALWSPHSDLPAKALLALPPILVAWLLALILLERTTGDRFMRLDDETATVGELANRAAHLNFAKLTGRDEQNHPDDVWRTLTWLCRQPTAYAGEINHDTSLIAN